MTGATITFRGEGRLFEEGTNAKEAVMGSRWREWVVAHWVAKKFPEGPQVGLAMRKPPSRVLIKAQQETACGTTGTCWKAATGVQMKLSER